MIELYFVFYRIPKMMSRLAREHRRSAVAWSAIAIVGWIVAELFVALSLGIFYGVGVIFWGWPENEPALFTVLVYVFALGAAIGSLALTRRILIMTNPKEFPPPPLPPSY
jgi:hypothetical protein